jgi:hypothetical protein
MRPEVTRSVGLLTLLHFCLNACLLWFGYYWLGVGESRTSTLLWSACVALVIIASACWCYGTTFAYFQAEDQRRLLFAWKSALRNLLPIAVAAVVVVVIYVLLARWAEYGSEAAFKIASYLTLRFRKPIRPSTVLRIFSVVLWIVRWVVLPVLLAPTFSAVAARGWVGFRSISARIGSSATRRWLYWIEAPLLTLGAVWVPLKLLRWVPHMHGFRMEMLSFTLRAGVAYLLFAGAGLLLAFVTSGGRPRFTQSNTLASP